jgi:pyruvate/2-oxoglutarate dehydrogenase complex dihydrolipoamide dehydrogenase (E3) component
MPVESFDAIVVGTGQSGPPLAARMSKEGWKVAVVERRRFGGTCVNYGCIPTKTMVASARAAHVARRAGEFGVRLAGELRVDMAAVHARTRKVAGDSEAGVEKWMRNAPGVEVILGHARFTGPRKLRVEGSGGAREIEAPKVFLDVGGRPVVPKLPGLDGVPFLTNIGMLELTTLPRHLVVLGGSYIGLEFAQMFLRFGSEVTVIEQSARLLPREDEDVGAEIQRILSTEGVAFRIANPPKSVAKDGEGVAVTLADGTRIAGSHLLVATGRRPNTDDLGAELGGVKLDARGYVEVDDQLRTSAEGVWALGDCNGKGAFTHTSYNDFQIAAANFFDGGTRKVSDRVPIYAMFVDPPLGRLGLNEAQVRARGRPALVAKLPMSRVGRARERGEMDGFLKVHVDAGTKEILGAAFVGIEADEAVQTLAPVMVAKQPYTVVVQTVMIHPTVNELVPYLLEEFLKPLPPA